MTFTNESRQLPDLTIGVGQTSKALPKFIPTDRDLVAAVAIAIATNPLVADTEILNPLDGSRVEIAKVKLYGGRELTEPGLVLAIYPDTASVGGGDRGYLKEEQLALAPGNSKESVPYLQANLVAKLTYQLSDFDYGLETKYASVDGKNYYFQTADRILDLPQGFKGDLKSIELAVLPAEEILKEWITLLRYAIRDISILQPWRVRNPQIVSVCYETAELFKKANGADAVLHSAWIKFKFSYTDIAI